MSIVRAAQGRRSRVLPLIAALTMFTLAVIIGGVASAHSYLESSTPATGAVLKNPPKSITLTFSEDVQTQGAGIAVAGPSGTTTLQPRVNGRTVTAEWPADLAEGKYDVEYRVVSDDGHVMNGTVDFRIQPAAETKSPEPRESQSAPTTAATPTATSSSAGEAPATVPPWLLGLGGLVALLAVLGVVLGRRNQDRP